MFYTLLQDFDYVRFQSVHRWNDKVLVKIRHTAAMLWRHTWFSVFWQYLKNYLLRDFRISFLKSTLKSPDYDFFLVSCRRDSFFAMTSRTLWSLCHEKYFFNSKYSDLQFLQSLERSIRSTFVRYLNDISKILDVTDVQISNFYPNQTTYQMVRFWWKSTCFL